MNKCIDTQLGHSNTTRVPDIARLHSKFHRISKSLTVRPEGSHTQPQKSGCANPDGAGQHGNRKHHQRESESLPNCSETRPKPVSCPKSCTNKGPSRFRTVLEEGSTLPGTVLERRRLAKPFPNGARGRVNPPRNDARGRVNPPRNGARKKQGSTPLRTVLEERVNPPRSGVRKQGCSKGVKPFTNVARERVNPPRNIVRKRVHTLVNAHVRVNPPSGVRGEIQALPKFGNYSNS